MVNGMLPSFDGEGHGLLRRALDRRDPAVDRRRRCVSRYASRSRRGQVVRAGDEQPLLPRREQLVGLLTISEKLAMRARRLASRVG